jgi:hypothetical protein
MVVCARSPLLGKRMLNVGYRFIPMSVPGVRMNNLIGQKNGRLEIIGIKGIREYNNPSKSRLTYWFAVCDCGNEHVVEGQKFVRGESVYCGCLTKCDYIEAKKHLDGTVYTPADLRSINKHFPYLMDQKFGHLTVTDLSHAIKYVIFSNKREKFEDKWVFHWICRCRCGKEVIRSNRYLVSKKDMCSCGCLSPKNRNRKFDTRFKCHI